MEIQKRKEFDDTTGCPVCYDTFGTEKCLPRLLPCTHSVCHDCVVKILGNRRFLKCPQCRKKHNALTGLNAFPENKYIINNLRPRGNHFMFPSCAKHGRELSIYCKSKGCEKDICQICFLEEHNGHNGVDIMQDENDKAKCCIKPLNNYISSCRKILRDAQKEVRTRGKEGLEELQTVKTHYVRMFDMQIERVGTLMQEEDDVIEQQLVELDKQSRKFSHLKSQVETGAKDSNTRKRVQMADQIKADVKETMNRKTMYRFFECTNLMHCKNDLITPGPDMIVRTVSMKSPICDIHSTFLAKGVVCFHVLPDESIVACEEENKTYTLAKYNMNGHTLFKAKLAPKTPKGMIEVTMIGDSFTICDRSEQRIDLRNIHNLKQFINNVTRKDRPNDFPGTLIYYDIQSGCNVRIQLQSENVPGLVEANSTECSSRIQDLCSMNLGSKQLRVIAMSSGKLRAYDETLNRLEWIADADVPGMRRWLHARSVTADNQGRIFAYDRANECIHKFSATGEYLGCVLREKEQGLKTIQHIRWSNNSSLVVGHTNSEGQCHISVVKVDA